MELLIFGYDWPLQADKDNKGKPQYGDIIERQANGFFTTKPMASWGGDIFILGIIQSDDTGKIIETPLYAEIDELDLRPDATGYKTKFDTYRKYQIDMSKQTILQHANGYYYFEVDSFDKLKIKDKKDKKDITSKDELNSDPIPLDTGISQGYLNEETLYVLSGLSSIGV